MLRGWPVICSEAKFSRSEIRQFRGRGIPMSCFPENASKMLSQGKPESAIRSGSLIFALRASDDSAAFPRLPRELRTCARVRVASSLPLPVRVAWRQTQPAGT